MSQSVIETPALKVVCKSQDCEKEYASKGGMNEHYRKKHRTEAEIQSPLGRFPSITHPARVLFTDNLQAEQPSTQGNSKGQINSPKVVSNATFQCNDCNYEVTSKNELDMHKNDKHEQVQIQHDPLISDEVEDTEDAEKELQTEADVMEDAKKELDIYEALENLAESAFDPEDNKDKKVLLKEQLIRYKSIMIKKNRVIDATREKSKKSRTLDRNIEA